MIITIQNKGGDFSQYDVEKISDVQSRLNAKTRISKVGTLDVVAEALSFASQAHRAELESILIGCSEAKVEITKEEARSVPLGGGGAEEDTKKESKKAKSK
tara:strand:+ start:2109 stop:2411 length:303 start_codon:yes stop_codon:yes gene_type:complete